VSTYKPARGTQKALPGKAVHRPEKEAGTIAGLKIPYPLLWLSLAAFVVYCPTIFYAFTDLDDSIFVRDFHAYNEDLRNLLTSFQRGLFDAIKDPYYRPLFMDSMIVNYKISGDGQNIASYHFINILFHITAVIFLYRLFIRLGIGEVRSFILTLLFAVHPVLSQAVAWIPGRNDTMLAIFAFPFLSLAIDYANTGKIKTLVLSAIFLMLAFFTKETAVCVPPVAFVLIVFVLNKKWSDRRNLIQYGVWLIIFACWYIIRAMAVPKSEALGLGAVFSGFFHRLPVIIQYTGKIFLPFNLSVFPTQEDTVYYFGFIAIAILAIVLYLNKERKRNIILSGLGIYLLLLLPALFVPNTLNDQTFEHRLYLPMAGMLLVLSQSAFIKNKYSDKNLVIGGVVVSLLLAILNFQHQKNFADPLAFWTQAATTSPNSAYANMMLGAREDNLQDSYALFRKAYRLNPKEKYLNFYYGVMLQKEDSVKESEKYLLAEKNTSGYYECDFYLARVAMERKDMNTAIAELQAYLTKDVKNKIANQNLLLLYIDTRQKESAIAQARHMQQLGLDVPATVLAQLGI
jgi:hypothetical protein